MRLSRFPINFCKSGATGSSIEHSSSKSRYEEKVESLAQSASKLQTSVLQLAAKRCFKGSEVTDDAEKTKKCTEAFVKEMRKAGHEMSEERVETLKDSLQRQSSDLGGLSPIEVHKALNKALIESE